MISDDENLTLAASSEAADAANQAFYERFPFPWPPMTFTRLGQPDFETLMLNQSIGDFTNRRIPANARIWVAGCGTNQAVYTALRFPKAKVYGSDLSSTSLSICERTAQSLGITNLTLRQESLNSVSYQADFDYIICTGVVHHNSDPPGVLEKIARALRRAGVIELMVYNRFHRTFTTAFQKALRLITRHNSRCPTYDEELEVVKALAMSQPMASSGHLAAFRDANEPQLADALLQPVERSYTVESLNEMVAACGLELMLPCYTHLDYANGRVWTIQFSTSVLQEQVDALPNAVRWQIANLLLQEKSPLLWFYLQHREEPPGNYYEDEVNKRFLDMKFVRASTTRQNYVRSEHEIKYNLSSLSVPYPAKAHNHLVQRFVDLADGRLTGMQMLTDLGIDPVNRKAVTDMRNQTTTSSFPYLRPA